MGKVAAIRNTASSNFVTVSPRSHQLAVVQCEQHSDHSITMEDSWEIYFVDPRVLHSFRGPRFLHTPPAPEGLRIDRRNCLTVVGNHAMHGRRLDLRAS